MQLDFKPPSLLGDDIRFERPVLFVYDVRAPQAGETVFESFERDQERIVHEYGARLLSARQMPADRLVRDVLVVDLRWNGQSPDQALQDLSRVLTLPNSHYAPDARRLWQEVRFLTGSLADATLSDQRTIP